ncbi:5-dehydro-4-deoxy-D-glucuronate isomerase [Cryobacterium breve]|uniref:4-deoxy-L-threo-5-hexosulose-uronate ketol-isomerase n=1 Tax=Cryobacterium breve TaxID=1259258 RepID=A0ABY7NFV9_9MICO|nr:MULTISPECIES: 5-dehydro-4-deoxy-D-glucuronate isomerase [Cryobacterium]MDY7541131.1 5-dehydro-4-deoxy-D-glucuronate isomerase [Cryobacterium sp. 5B3]MEA9998880.1 5-dehydro-4-deoxy-D-glucuronate isomerase [Cryobacterium sp. RTS3]MEB0265742.1 5-dehydro-4-deoxy-D-glucuronate isomerase [Cryobacterium sp. 10I5]MEB0274298.1 5-dehydro-4-deoxy-D-glucuronate isomerase [Cryobacterium sp. 5B3]WBM80862.1 5-dehydro-4-deoxy-D-glucuronate isomerase [Cryobacterium breve]
MQIRNATSPTEVQGMTTAELRERFLVTDLFVDDELRAVYSHEDRVILVGVSPVTSPLTLESFPELRTDHFFERREAGVVNVGGSGTVVVDGVPFDLGHGSCLYIGRGASVVEFISDSASAAPETEDAARFYVFSAPAHTAYPTTLVPAGTGIVRELGDQSTSNRRTLNQYIHENGVRSCQVVMGVTSLHEGSMWNTMPAHTHDRRMEAYLYFDLPEAARVVHLMGEPTETRHLIVANRQATIAPSWSIHSGVGTSNYSFIWAMAGENQSFDDMDAVDITAVS